MWSRRLEDTNQTLQILAGVILSSKEKSDAGCVLCLVGTCAADRWMCLARSSKKEPSNWAADSRSFFLIPTSSFFLSHDPPSAIGRLQRHENDHREIDPPPPGDGHHWQGKGKPEGDDPDATGT